MLPRQNRITKQKDFEKIFKKGAGLKEGCLIFKFIITPNAVSRFSFITSQKVSKSAVIRNKIRRRLRDLVKKEMPEIKKTVEGVFIAQSGLEKLGFEETKQLFKKIIKKANLS